MTQTRYKDQLYTPGPQTPGKPIIERFNQGVADKWNEFQTRKRELQIRLNHVNHEVEQVKTNAVAMLIEDCDIDEYIGKLARLRIEAEILEGAINHLTNRADALKRGNPWLTSR